ncbi:hypothetical protein KDN32_12710 [Nocardioides sp. J2M5]|uniref:esterase/lipase family protein n=1 Tax=Nocardioides palaemonis TaxID=2829810 RepID=UPI001BAD1E70|nr:hypothetical protein [Nocardioides palaemonis]MBS2938599.1 hypothetical protein [Nocardioides palaemonis]
MQVTLQPVPVDLGEGVTIEAPGLVGTAEIQPGVLGGRSDTEPNATPTFVAALDEQDFHQQHAIEVQAEEEPFATDGLTTRSGAPGMTLRVPDLGQDQPQVLMVVDEAGVVTWHLPEADTADPGKVAFTVDRRVADSEVAATDGSRGLVAAIGTKLLTVFVVPVIEKVVGRAGREVARVYEDRTHPQGVRWMTKDGFRTAGSDPVTDWSLLSEGRALLFVHGTASSSHGAFRGLDDATFGALHTAYGGRVLAFDHHTLSASLDDNVEELRRHLPPERRIPVDIVSHSRGGLVARAISEAMTAPDTPLDVRSLVYVATPNGGTTLADPKRIHDYLDRMTTMLNLIPDGPWSTATDTLSGLLTLVRSVLAGVVQELPGLAVMRPGNDRLAVLPFLGATGAREYAVDVEFEPSGPLLRLMRAANAAVDSVFREANDVVVPTGGVRHPKNRSDLAIPPDRHLSLGKREDAWHCAMFSQDATREALKTWLAAPMNAAPGTTPVP